MTKKELIRQAEKTMWADYEDFVATQTECESTEIEYWRPLSREELSRAYDVFRRVAWAELLERGEILLVGLGKLKVKEVAARAGRNPRTGERIEIPASRKIVFVPVKALREALHEKSSPRQRTAKKTQTAKQRRK